MTWRQNGEQKTRKKRTVRKRRMRRLLKVNDKKRLME